MTSRELMQSIEPPVKSPGEKGAQLTPSKPRRVKGELTGKQLVFLQALKDNPGVSRANLCVLANAHPTNVTANALGYEGKESRERRDIENGYPSLLTLGHVRIDATDVDGVEEALYYITDSGLDALQAAAQ